MAGKRQLWKEFWRDAEEVMREYNGCDQPSFRKVFKERGILKRFEALSDMDSYMTTAILGGCRHGGERIAYPVDTIRNGKIIKVWKLTQALIASELKQVRKAYRRGSRELAILHNKVTKRIERQTGQQLTQLALEFFDEDGPKELAP
jgi:hypothetical protein